MRFLITVFLCFVLFNSCTIEKRLHGRGYHISWNKRYSSKKSKEVEKKLEEEELVTEEVMDSTETVVEGVPVAEVDSLQISKQQKEEARKEKYPDLPKAERKFEPLGVLSAKILAVAFGAAFLYDRSSTAEMDITWSVVFLVCAALSFVLGIVSMVRYLRNPRHYKFNIWALLSIAFGIFYLVMLFLGNVAMF